MARLGWVVATIEIDILLAPISTGEDLGRVILDAHIEPTKNQRSIDSQRQKTKMNKIREYPRGWIVGSFVTL